MMNGLLCSAAATQGWRDTAALATARGRATVIGRAGLPRPRTWF